MTVFAASYASLTHGDLKRAVAAACERDQILELPAGELVIESASAQGPAFYVPPNKRLRVHGNDTSIVYRGSVGVGFHVEGLLEVSGLHSVASDATISRVFMHFFSKPGGVISLADILTEGGHGVWSDSGDVEARDCDFDGHTHVACFGPGQAEFVRCEFSATTPGGQDHALYINRARDVMLDQCRFVSSYGYGLHLYGGPPSLNSAFVMRDCVVEADCRSGVILAGTGSPMIVERLKLETCFMGLIAYNADVRMRDSVLRGAAGCENVIDSFPNGNTRLDAEGCVLASAGLAVVRRHGPDQTAPWRLRRCEVVSTHPSATALRADSGFIECSDTVVSAVGQPFCGDVRGLQ